MKAALIHMHHNIPQTMIGKQPARSARCFADHIKVMTEAIVWALRKRNMLLTVQEVLENCNHRDRRHPFPLLELTRGPRSVVVVNAR